MARRFTYAEKGKDIDTSLNSPPRKRIRAPPLDTSDLVRENALTLMGLLTNPREQKLWSMIPFMSKRWELRGKAIGSDLGNNCFQFRFDYEDDLQKVLDNRPYQYSRWMLILQRWEPIISPNFPSQIPFWIKLTGLPLHYWKKDLLLSIGKEIGDLKDHELTKTSAKFKVEINCLNPLTKEAIVEFEEGSESLVTLEYVKLGKHCSYCFSLFHEVETCSTNPQVKSNLHQASLVSQGKPNHLKPPFMEATRGKSYSQRQERYGNYFGERLDTRRPDYPKPSSSRVLEANNSLIVPSTDSENHRTYAAPQPYQRERVSPSQRHYSDSTRRLNQVQEFAHKSHHLVSGHRAPNPPRDHTREDYRSPPSRIWREKDVSETTRRERSASSQPRQQ